jgi:hypothetical protein
MATRDQAQTGEVYRIPLPDSEDWTLPELYNFPHAYQQCYSFIYSLETDLPARDRERIDEAFASYPWKGGYSYVNIYSVLYNQIPPRAKPRVKGIHKASEGWLDLVLNLDAAIELAKAVALIAGSGAAAAAAYAKAAKILANIRAEREKAKLRELRLTQEQLRAVRGSCDELAKALGFKNLADLHRRTGDPEVSLKMLAAHARRMKVLVNFVQDGKAILPTDHDS